MAKRAKRKYPCRMEIVGMPPDRQYPWKNGDYILMLGEIVDMQGHYVIVTEDGKTHFGYHDDFMVPLK